jgi:hypothetical protein
MLTPFVTTFAVVAALATAAPVRAQEVHLIATVPFEFTVGTADLPRDTYRISRLTGHPEMLMVRGDRHSTFVRIDPVDVPRDNASPSLTFHRYGDQYFLREIRWEGNARLDLPETNAERAVAERRADRSASRMETVVIVAER